MDDYDEFGNYIGPLSDSELGSEDDYAQDAQPDAPPPLEEPAPLEGYDDGVDDERLGSMELDEEGNIVPQHALIRVDEGPSNAVVLHEDKQYYPSASEVYGEDVETMVQEEDAQPLSVPIVEPVKVRRFAVQEEGLPETRFDRSFLSNLMNFPDMVRNVAVVGHLHHGKTSLLDTLVYETHKMEVDMDTHLRYTDAHLLERDRGISIKSAPLSLVMEGTKRKSYLLNLIDTPGHTNFQDEVAAACRLADGVVLVVDVVEGVMCNTIQIIRHCIRQNLPIVLVLNKLDRLILELRLPPQEAYYKIRHTIQEVNNCIASFDANPSLQVGPERGNVAFASTQMGYCFTLRSFAKLYAETYGAGVDVDAFARRLWGNIYYNAESRNFSRKAPDAETKRSFVHFILEPLYKMYTAVLSSDTDSLKRTLAGLGIRLKPAAYKVDVRPLLRIVLNQFFGPSQGFVDLVVDNVPSPKEAAVQRPAKNYTGPSEGAIHEAMAACDADAPLVVQITKLYPTLDAQEFRAFGRVMSGTARPGMRVKVLGEQFSQDDEEDLALATIEDVGINETRYVVPTTGVPAGNWVLLTGVDASISKTGTIVDASLPTEDLHIFSPLDHMTQSVLKVAVEPLNPSELPKMLEALRRINKTYPLATTKVEESGEHVILGTGELYLDCVLHDLRVLFAEIEIRVSDPVVRFCETVVETSSVKCYAGTPNKRNRLTIICEPLEKGVAEDIEAGVLEMRMAPKELGKILRDKYGWDLLASRSVWAFGPDERGANVLVDDTLPSEVDKKLLYTVKESIAQGFQWACREGPLADEPMRNVKFRILDAELAPEAIHRGGGQIIPTARRAAYAAFLLATPRLMEPIYSVEVQTPAAGIAAVYTILAKRRGHVVKDTPKPGSTLVTVQAYIPVIDANGFETDLRIATQGAAMVLMMFSHWSIVPGNPTDGSVKLRPLEPAPPLGLAKDFVVKTRRRKGLPEGVGVASYLDADMTVALAQAGIEM
ncbi:Translation elongation factor EFTu/EF1A, domain 2 [Kalmanozyma brasiliensis GHG001]|uniref:Elongation factor 2 n=1 Tax=Kalmanozyma brasiliensis (strain GHG001) TaxID=1365824 RepID=V5E4P1_KALBG|nr:Translation elongation factor EFTu/EF1A, domain 2 [Kalmanozyma brasiliensis GHG001]EST05161.1 Translation elongation factor EFTu/EF1A, domain 2 [Kalmanozyma brasiliensis GHG001]